MSVLSSINVAGQLFPQYMDRVVGGRTVLPEVCDGNGTLNNANQKISQNPRFA
jgi:hypothetical protein